MESTNKKIYIMLSFTGTILSRIVKVVTLKEYSHVSVALDLEFNSLYSFGRINPKNPFSGGFVHRPNCTPIRFRKREKF